MASLVLGVAGSAIGSAFGTLGASIGWSIGAMLGNLLFPQKVEGPRVSDLRLQGSRYGAMIPQVWGSIRVPGNVIWTTDLVEHSETEGGKGGPEVTTYSYTASFASLLCEGPIAAVTRIWADGRLIHDTTSYESEASVPHTLYLGTEDQLPDPRMEAELGVGNVPAHRGYAYVVFEDMDLSEFGNRIPNLEFEVLTRGHTDDAIHIVKEDDTGPIAYRDIDVGHNDGPLPQIVRWPISGDRTIRIAAQDLAEAYEYDADDLTYIATTSKSVDDLRKPENALLESPSFGTTWQFAGVGMYMSGGGLQPIWVKSDNAIAIGGQNPAVASETLYLDDAEVPNTTNNLAYNAGLPLGQYVVGALLSQDRTMLFLFTAAAPLDVADAWYKLVDGEIVDQGTCNLTSGPAANELALGAQSIFNVNLSAGEFENNGRWAWIHHSSDSGITTYHIDDAKVFSYNTVGGIGVYSVPRTFKHSSLRVIKEGFCALVVDNKLLVYSRFPIGETLAVPLPEVVEDLCTRAGLEAGQVNTDRIAGLVDGFVIAQQQQVRSAIEQLRAVHYFDAVESSAQVKFVARGEEPVVTIPDDDLAAYEFGSEPPALVSTSRTKEDELPRTLNVTYLDPETDYQQGHQYDRRETVGSESEATIDVSMVLDKSRARQVAQANLLGAWLERDKHTIFLSRRYADLEPTDVINVRGRTLRLTTEDFGATGVIRFDGVPSLGKLWASGPAGVPRLGHVPTVPSVQQDTDLLLLDLPPIDDDDAELGYYVAAAGHESPRWKGAGLFRSPDGTNYSSIAQLSAARTFGNTTTALGDFEGGNVFDEISSVTVQIGAGGGSLSSYTAEQVLAGSGMYLVGDEIIGAKYATQVSASVYRLSGLLRGRRGTEWAMNQHVALERFVVLPVTDQPMSFADVGVLRSFKAVTVGQAAADADTVPFVSRGIRLKPFAPVLLGGGVDASNDVALVWTRRTRIGGGGLNGIAPLGEETEAYVVQIWNQAFTQVARIIEVTEPTATYTSAMQVADFGTNQQRIYFTVGQVGRLGLGYQAQGVAPGGGGAVGAPLVPIDPYEDDEPPPVSAPGTPDQNHMDNFAAYMGGDIDDQRLAHHYAEQANSLSVPVGWYQRNENAILLRFFGGDAWRRNLWIHDATLNKPFLTTAEFETIFAQIQTANG